MKPQTKNNEQADSFDHCRNFWDGALDEADEIDHCLRKAMPTNFFRKWIKTACMKIQAALSN